MGGTLWWFDRENDFNRNSISQVTGFGVIGEEDSDLSTRIVLDRKRHFSHYNDNEMYWIITNDNICKRTSSSSSTHILDHFLPITHRPEIQTRFSSSATTLLFNYILYQATGNSGHHDLYWLHLPVGTTPISKSRRICRFHWPIFRFELTRCVSDDYLVILGALNLLWYLLMADKANLTGVSANVIK